jgi:hypothetical protein
MRSLYLILITFILFAPACDGSKDKPKDLIPKEKMSLILTDMVLLEATYNTRLIRLTDKDERMVDYNEEILDQHQVSKEAFDDSYDYYLAHEEDFEAIMELVFEELNKMETEALKYNEVSQKTDSTLVSE